MNRHDQPGRDCGSTREPCAELPALVRMNYFHGQLISERDLKTDQAYFRERLRHMNRCLHGYGVICGLEVTGEGQGPDCIDQPAPQDDGLKAKLAEVEKRLAETKDQMSKAQTDAEKQKLEETYKALAAEREAILRQLEAQGTGAAAAEAAPPPQGHCSDAPATPWLIGIGCGAAIDCAGNDLVLAHPVKLDLAALLSPADQRRIEAAGGATAWLRICHVECGIEPARPFAMDSCATNVACTDTRIREDVRFTLSLDPPDEEQCCETCCCSCGEECLVLAAIRLDPGKALGNGAIDQSVRRPIGLYQPVVITGVSWQHGASYDAKTANQVLGTKDESGGLLIKFSRPVHVSTLLPGVIEIWRVAGGRGVSGIVTGVDGEYVGLPASGFVSEVRYRDTTGETVQGRDRIIVVVKGDFILDRCCRPVAAANIGGRVPALPEAPQPLSAPDFAGICSTPPAGRMAWTSGHGGVFESWFTVAED